MRSRQPLGQVRQGTKQTVCPPRWVLRGDGETSGEGYPPGAHLYGGAGTHGPLSKKTVISGSYPRLLLPKSTSTVGFVSRSSVFRVNVRILVGMDIRAYLDRRVSMN